MVRPRLSSPHPPLRADRGCVASFCPVAAAVGTRVLRDGGNAVDAAVATALALSVTRPQAAGLGGGGFLVFVPHDEAPACIDYREVAPARLSAAHFSSPDRSVAGALSVGVPGTIAGLAAALARYGTWPWDRVVAPAIDVATSGVWLTTQQAGYLEIYCEALCRHASTRGYFTEGGQPPRPGALLRQPDLASCLRALADDGPEVFYSGDIAHKLVAEVEQCGGVLDLEDLASYRPVWREPYRRRFAGREVITPPLPSGGGLIVPLALALCEACGIPFTPARSRDRALLLARIFRAAFACRMALAGDPAALPQRVLEESERWAQGPIVAGDLDTLIARFGGETRRAAGHSTDTTHFSVVDSSGNAVSNTFSLNTTFGSKLAVGGAGFLLNNCIDDFQIDAAIPNWFLLEHGEWNQLAPGRRPATTMAPTVVRGDAGVELVVGSAGGPRIATTIVQIIVGIVVDGLSARAAVEAPRVHHQHRPDVLAVETTFGDEIVAQLRGSGITVEPSPGLGLAAAIHRPPGADELQLAVDQRYRTD